MNWISNVVRPKIRSFLRREVPENLWVKCPETGQLVFYRDLEANQFVIPNSNYHMRMSALARLKALFDYGQFEDIPVPEVFIDPLKFRDERRYVDRLKDARAKTGLEDAIKIALGRLEGLPVVAAVQSKLGGGFSLAVDAACSGLPAGGSCPTAPESSGGPAPTARPTRPVRASSSASRCRRSSRTCSAASVGP